MKQFRCYRFCRLFFVVYVDINIGYVDVSVAVVDVVVVVNDVIGFVCFDGSGGVLCGFCCYWFVSIIFIHHLYCPVHFEDENNDTKMTEYRDRHCGDAKSSVEVVVLYLLQWHERGATHTLYNEEGLIMRSVYGW